MEYKGLEYSTEYTFTLPGNSVGDLTGNFLADDIVLHFTTKEMPEVQKGLYDQYVTNTEELVAAITAANSRSDKSTRYRIFIYNGTTPCHRAPQRPSTATTATPTPVPSPTSPPPTSPSSARAPTA